MSSSSGCGGGGSETRSKKQEDRPSGRSAQSGRERLGRPTGANGERTLPLISIPAAPERVVGAIGRLGASFRARRGSRLELGATCCCCCCWPNRPFAFRQRVHSNLSPEPAIAADNLLGAEREREISSNDAHLARRGARPARRSYRPAATQSAQLIARALINNANRCWPIRQRWR